MNSIACKQIEDFPRYYVYENGEIWDSYNERYLKACRRNKKSKYLCVSLRSDKDHKVVNVHRIVAKAFIENPMNLPEVNHKDEDPSNNNVSNLEWCGRAYNDNYGSRNIRISQSQLNRKDVSKPVVQYDLAGHRIADYPSVMEAARKTGTTRSAISRCCQKNPLYHTANGYRWEWGE